jgi:hypothetical protein
MKVHMNIHRFFQIFKRKEYRKEREQFFKEIDEDIEKTPKEKYVSLDEL